MANRDTPCLGSGKTMPLYYLVRRQPPGAIVFAHKFPARRIYPCIMRQVEEEEEEEEGLYLRIEVEEEPALPSVLWPPRAEEVFERLRVVFPRAPTRPTPLNDVPPAIFIPVCRNAQFMCKEMNHLKRTLRVGGGIRPVCRCRTMIPDKVRGVGHNAT
jgi:hypothetical protein